MAGRLSSPAPAAAAARFQPLDKALQFRAGWLTGSPAAGRLSLPALAAAAARQRPAARFEPSPAPAAPTPPTGRPRGRSPASGWSRRRAAAARTPRPDPWEAPAGPAGRRQLRSNQVRTKPCLTVSLCSNKDEHQANAMPPAMVSPDSRHSLSPSGRLPRTCRSPLEHSASHHHWTL